MNSHLVVRHLLEDDIPGGTPAGERHDTRGVDPDELAMGLEVEREHVRGPRGGTVAGGKRIAQEIALDHLTDDEDENGEPDSPNYYSKGRAAGLFGELDR